MVCSGRACPARYADMPPICKLYLCVYSTQIATHMVGYSQSGKSELPIMNALIVAVMVTILGAVTIPLLEMAGEQAKSTTLLQNLHTLRSQIELYKLEHNENVPVFYQGSLPQLIRATDVDGVPSAPGSKHPYGPYFRSGIPINPVTGRSIVTTTDTFPPTAPSGNGGWLYHQPTGQIAADLAEFLGK